HPTHDAQPPSPSTPLFRSLDSEYARRLAPSFLPDTEMKYGRASKPSSHWVYLVASPHDVRHTKFDGLPVSANGTRKTPTLLERRDRKSTRLNSSHVASSYA